MIIMVARNNLDLSRQCLRTLLAQHGQPPVLLVDNASSDATGVWTRSQILPGCQVLSMSLQEPQSVAWVWNQGLNFAWSNGFRRALVVNNDTELLPGTCQMLNSFLESLSSIGMATCVSVRERERLVMPESGELLYSNHPDYSCFMINKWAHERVPFDERCTGAFYEDNVHHVEMHRAGIPTVNTGIPFLHHGSATIRSADPAEKKRIERHADANRHYFFTRYGCYPGTRSYEKLFEATGL